VTEIQAFLSRPSADVKGKTDRTTHIFSTDSRTRLLDIPTLYYEFSYSLSKASSSPRNSLLTNGFSLAHQFNEVFSGGARVAREDIDEPSSDGASYIYSASLNAVPFNTLSHTLLFSGRNDVLGDESVDRNSLFLQNRAHIYKGLDTFLHGGITKTTPEIGQDQDTTSWILGVSATPHRILTLTYNMDSRKTDSSGGGIPDETRTDRRRDLSLTYRPFQTVYVTGILSRVIEPDRKETLKNYTLNFSPFPDGALQINVFYSERLNTEDDGKSRSLNPSLRWNITNRAILEFSYQKIKNESDRGSSDLKTFNVNTRLIY
jgi:hypothetical protein